MEKQARDLGEAVSPCGAQNTVKLQIPNPGLQCYIPNCILKKVQFAKSLSNPVGKGLKGKVFTQRETEKLVLPASLLFVCQNTSATFSGFFLKRP